MSATLPAARSDHPVRQDRAVVAVADGGGGVGDHAEDGDVAVGAEDDGVGGARGRRRAAVSEGAAGHGAAGAAEAGGAGGGQPGEGDAGVPLRRRGRGNDAASDAAPCPTEVGTALKREAITAPLSLLSWSFDLLTDTDNVDDN